MRIALLILPLVFFTACAAMVTPLADFAERPPTTKVDLYTDRSAVRRPFKEMALLSWGNNRSGMGPIMIENYKKAAREIGADGIVMWHGIDGSIQVLAIYYTDTTN